MKVTRHEAMQVTRHAAMRHAERARGINTDVAGDNEIAASMREIEHDLDTPRISDTLDFVGNGRAKIKISTARGPVTYVLLEHRVVTCYMGKREDKPSDSSPRAWRDAREDERMSKRAA